MSTTYQISVITGDLDQAGTDARVYITLMGEKGSFERQLGNPRNNFQRGCQDVFTYEMPDLGKLERIRVHHDNSGDHPGWLLERIVVYTEATQHTGGFRFPCGQWLAKTVGDGRIDRTLLVE